MITTYWKKKECMYGKKKIKLDQIDKESFAKLKVLSPTRKGLIGNMIKAILKAV